MLAWPGKGCKLLQMCYIEPLYKNKRGFQNVAQFSVKMDAVVDLSS